MFYTKMHFIKYGLIHLFVTNQFLKYHCVLITSQIKNILVYTIIFDKLINNYSFANHNLF